MATSFAPNPAAAVLVDAGPLIALIEPTDRHHRACVAALAGIDEPLLTVWPAFIEAIVKSEAFRTRRGETP